MGHFFCLYISMEEIKQKEKFMQMAIDLSKQNVINNLGTPFGAVIVKDGEVIAKSANVVFSTNDPTAHAEVAAIRLACKKLNTYDLSGTVIYTSCEPCPMCLGAIYWAKIGTVYYGNTKQDAAAINFDDQFIYNELDLPLESRQVPFVQLLRNEALKSFELWEKSPLKKPNKKA